MHYMTLDNSWKKELRGTVMHISLENIFYSARTESIFRTFPIYWQKTV